VDCAFRLGERTRGDRGERIWWIDLQKKTAVEDGPVVYDKIPKEVIVTRGKDHGLHVWEQQWMDTRRGSYESFFSHQ